MNYNSLTAQIQAYAYRSDPAFIAVIPDIINQAMSRIYSEATALGFQRTVAGTFTPNSPLVTKPDDYKSSINFQFVIPINGNNPAQTNFLLERTYEFCITYAPFPAARGVPLFYSTDLDVSQIQGLPQFYIAPIPTVNYNYQLTYLSFPPLFNAQNQDNFLTQRYPNLLLYACMMETIPYLKSDERIPVFESLYKRALDGVNTDTHSRYIDRYSKRDKD